jgi:RNA polymerase sigma-70 factor (ECF subfamily)
MDNQTISSKSLLAGSVAEERFLNLPNEESFADLFKVLNPQLVAFFRSRGCEWVAEDLAQEVMFTVYRKAAQLRDRSLFRRWVFKIARNSLCRHFTKRTREVETLDLAHVPERLVTASNPAAGTPAFEFHHWMEFLDSRESETLTLRFIEQWEYHEIAAAQAIPIGTVQWRVFRAKKKLAPHLKRAGNAAIGKAA